MSPPLSEPPPPESEKRIATRPPEEEENASAPSEPSASERLAATRVVEREPDAIAGVLHALEHLETDAKIDRPAIEPPAPPSHDEKASASIATATEVSAEASAKDEWEENTGAEIVDLKRVIVRPADTTAEKVESVPAADTMRTPHSEPAADALDSEEDSDEEDSDEAEGSDDVANEASREVADEESSDEEDSDDDVANQASRQDSDEESSDEESSDEEDSDEEDSDEEDSDEEDSDEETSTDQTESGAEIAAAADETDPDEVSVPPIGDLTVERFFSQGEFSRSLDEPQDEVSEKAKLKAAPHVVERRAKLARYVSWAVGISAVVILAAFARTVVGRSQASNVPPRAAAAAVEAPPMPKEAPIVPVATAVAEPATTTGEPPPAPAETAAPPTEPAAAVAADPTAKPEGDAKQEKEASRKALELQKLQDAIDAGERAVALDPTDGEAWLILGVAYQMKGKVADAQRTYKKCLEQAKTRKSECAQFAR